jgi:RNAse (barnase) inhibitor barstar
MSVLWFDGMLEQLQDAGVYFLPDADIDELMEAAAVNGYARVRIDLQGCTDKSDLLKRMAAALHFPAHFGHNWDALADALGDLRRGDVPGFVLLFECSQTLRQQAPAEFKIAMEVLQAACRDWAERKTPFWCFIALSEAEFDALD